MKPVVKINFEDFWTPFDKRDNPFFRWLSVHFTVVLSDDPDFLFYSCYGFNHLKYACYRILYCGENQRVNWNACDWAFSFDYLKDIRHFRLPNWFLYDDGRKLLLAKPDSHNLLQSKKGFCNMIVSNPHPTKRIEFFNKLSEYKRVDSGGRFMNNIGGPVDDKIKFIMKYKFTIAFENSSYPGYTTEKLFQPMIANSIPIYWGNPLVGLDFNSAAFVNWHDFENDNSVIDYIIKLDKNDDLFLQMFNEPWYSNSKLPDCINEDLVVNKLKSIVESYGRKKPVAQTGKDYLYRAGLQIKRVDGFLNRHLGYRKHFR